MGAVKAFQNAPHAKRHSVHVTANHMKALHDVYASGA